MPQITVNRTSEYSNRLRKIQLLLDNQVIGEIKNGEVKIINVNPGKHTFKAKIDWCYSNEIEFNINNEENKEFSLKGTSSLLALYYITFAKDKYLKLEIQN